MIHVAIRARAAIYSLRVPTGDVNVGRPVRQKTAAEGSASTDRNAYGVLLSRFHLLAERFSVVHKVVHLCLEQLTYFLRDIFPIKSDSVR